MMRRISEASRNYIVHSAARGELHRYDDARRMSFLDYVAFIERVAED